MSDRSVAMINSESADLFKNTTENTVESKQRLTAWREVKLLLHIARLFDQGESMPFSTISAPYFFK